MIGGKSGHRELPEAVCPHRQCRHNGSSRSEGPAHASLQEHRPDRSAGQRQGGRDLKRLSRFLDAAGYHVIIEDRTATVLLDHGHPEASRRLLGELCDLVIVVGGDGSLLGAARTLCHSGTLVLGVNRGRLGFLTDISPDELEARVGEVLEGRFEVEERFLLDAELYRDDT